MQLGRMSIYIKDCHESVAGIIAGCLRERYYRPVLVFTDASEEGQIKASGRSIDDYDMFTELSAFRNLFLRFGGHKMAAGLTMEKKNLEILRDGLNARCTLTQTQLMPLVMIDAAMPLGYISEEVIVDLDEPMKSHCLPSSICLCFVSHVSERIEML